MTPLVDETKIQQLLDDLNKSKEAIAKERNKLRELVAEFEDILDVANRADENLDEAIMALSELL